MELLIDFELKYVAEFGLKQAVQVLGTTRKTHFSGEEEDSFGHFDWRQVYPTHHAFP